MAETASARGWKEHSHEQLQAWLRLSPSERLAWLWQAKLFAEQARLAAVERRTEAAKRRR